MRYLAAIPLLFAAVPALAARVDDRTAIAIAIAKPQALIVDRSIAPTTRAAMLKAADADYGFWNNGSAKLLGEALAADFIDSQLPNGRPQGPKGDAYASKQFLAAAPDLRCVVIQRIVAGDRVVSQLRFTGHFTGAFNGVRGEGRAIDFIAFDVVRIRDGRIFEKDHLEDNVTFDKADRAGEMIPLMPAATLVGAAPATTPDRTLEPVFQSDLVVNRVAADRGGRLFLPVQPRIHGSDPQVVEVRDGKPDGRSFYFQPSNGRRSRIATRYLDDASLSDAELGSHVERFADTPSTGGTAIAADDTIYLSDVDTRRILAISPKGTITTLIADPRLA